MLLLSIIVKHIHIVFKKLLVAERTFVSKKKENEGFALVTACERTHTRLKMRNSIFFALH